MPSFFSFGNKFSFKNNKFTIRNSSLPDFNGINTGFAIWDGVTRHLTTVGTNGRPSYYGCFDMTGNAYTWNDLNGTVSGLRGLRGNDFDDYYTNDESGDYRYEYPTNTSYSVVGCRIASLNNPYSFPNFALVGDINNSADSKGYGAVSYTYYMNKYHLTNDEYAVFLNAIAKTDTYSVYSTSMNTDVRAGLIRSGSSGNYVYTVKNNYGNKPVVMVNWFQCVRYCNWLHNNKPTGAQSNSTTEGGAYTLNGQTSGNAVVKNAGAKYHIPTENEWYKAGYYKGGGTNKGYWLYGTQTNDRPSPVYADENGNGTIRPVALKPTTTTGTNVSTTPVSDRIYNTNIVVNYANVASNGITAITPITQNDPKLPANFSLSNNLGKYNISTNSSISGNIETCFTLPTSVTQAVFDKTRIFHTTAAGVTSDVTILTGANAPNYSLRKICARTTSFSDFHMIPETTFIDQPVPSNISGVPGNGLINLSWSMSDITGIENYIVKYSTDSGSSWTEFNHNAFTTTSTTVDGLTNGTNYVFTIASVSSSGTSNFSSTSSSFTPVSSVPDVVTGVSAIAGTNSATVSWDVPNNNGSSITNYNVQYSSNSGSSWTSSNDPLYLFSDDVSPTRSLIVTNLSAIPYIFRVSAVNGTGSGSYSSSSSSITPTDAAGVNPTPTPSSSAVAITPTPTATLTQTPTTTPTATITNTPTSSTIPVTPTPTSSPAVSYTTNAVMLTSGSSYTVPSGANSMKVWAIGAGGSVRTNGLYAGAGGVAYRTYSVTPGSTVSYTVNQTISGTSDTGGSNTTVTYSGITIRGYGGEPARGITWQLLGDSNIGLGGTFGGAADGGAAGGAGRNYGGYENGGSSGAVGRGGDGLNEWLGPQTGTPNSCKRITAADVSELFAALALASVNATESCGSTAAFGSSGFDAKFGPYKSAGIGGGGVQNPGYWNVRPNGNGAVVIKFMGDSVSNPKPSYTPTAVLLTSGAVNGALANIDGGFQGSLSNFQQYTVPSGATVVKAWAVGGGGHPNAGGVAYAEWMVYPGQIIYYRIGSYGQPSYIIGGHRELPTNEAAHSKKLLIGNGGKIIMNVGGAGSYGYYSGGDGGSNGSATTNYGDNEWGGAVGGATNHTINQRNQPNDVSGLLAAVTLAGGSTNFGAGGFDSKYTSLGPGIGGGARFSNGSQGCVVLYFT